MKTATVLICSVLVLTAANPNGQYHQEYNYKSSSSSYRNNELQHRDDQSGFYSKDGDLEGRFKPKVNAHNEHSEYINPKLQTHTYTGMNVGHNGAMDSYGQMNAQLGSGYNGHGSASGYDAHGSNSGYDSYGSNSGYSYSGGYGSSQSQYGVSSNLQSVTQRLQAQLEKQLQDMLVAQRGTTYSTYALNDLEAALRRNLTDRLDEELLNTYGAQSIKGGNSYSIHRGRVQQTANYNTQELNDLKRQLENNLLHKLRNEYRQYSESSSSSHNSNYRDYEYGTTSSTYRPYSTLYPNIYSTTSRPYIYPTSTTIRTFDSYNQHHETSSQIRYTPIPNPASITVIASNVQSDLDHRLNMLLESLQERYFSENAYEVTNYDVILNRLQNELRSNITTLLDEQIRRNYGTQILNGGYMYSTGSNGQLSTQHNYNIRDLENLKAQIERNLLQKLNTDFQSRRTRYQQSFHSSSVTHSNYGSNYGQQGAYETYSVRPVIAGVKTHGNNYQYSSGASHSGYETSGSSGVSQLQRQLQEDLSRQLQVAIQKMAYSSNHGYSSGSVNPQSFQMSLQELQNELNRNLTRQLEEVRSGYGSYSSYGGSSSVSESQLANLRNQLQTELQRQLQQGLSQSWSSSSSYSASASSSNFRPVRGLSFQGTPFEGQDCDDNTHQHMRLRRHTGSYGSYPSGYSYSTSYSSHTPYTSGYSHQHHGFGHHYSRHGANKYYGQQVHEEPGVGNLQIGHSNIGHNYFGHKHVELDQERDSFGKVQVGSTYGHRPQHITHHQYSGQEQIDLGQSIELDNLGKLPAGNQHSNNKYGEQQQVDVGQEIQDDNFGKLQATNQQAIIKPTQQVDLGQQIEDDGFGKLQVGSGQQIHTGQEQVDLGQEIEDDFEKLQVNQQSTNKYTGQHQVNVGQEIEDDNFGKLQIGNQLSNHQYAGQHQVDMGQEIEEDNFGKLQIGNQQSSHKYTGQYQDDVGQEIEDDNFGKLQIGQQQMDVGQESVDNFRNFQAGNQQSVNKQTGQQIQISQGQVHLGQVQEDDAYSNQQSIHKYTGQEQTNVGQEIENDNFGKLHIESQQSVNKHIDQQIQSGQEQVNLDHEIETPTSKYPGQIIQTDQEQVDLGQEIEDDTFGKLQIGNQQSTNTYTGQQMNAGQEIQNDNFGKLHTGSQTGQEQVDLGQELEEDTFGKIQIANQESINKYAGQQQIDVGQEIEDDNFGKFQLENQQSVNKFTGQQIQTGQEQVDLGQEIEDDAGKLEIGNQQSSNKYTGQQQMNVGQEIENDNFGKLHTGSQAGQEQIDLGQELEEDTFGKIQIANQESINKYAGQQQIDVGQEIEDDNFGKLQTGNQQSSNKFNQQQIQTGQKQVDLGQEIEEDNFAKLQVGSQQSSNIFAGQQIQTGQDIDEDNFGKLQVGSQQSNKRTTQNDGSLGSQNHSGQQNKFYNQVDYSHVNQQVEDNALGKGETNSQKPQSMDGQFLTSIGHQAGSGQRNIEEENDLLLKLISNSTKKTNGGPNSNTDIESVTVQQSSETDQEKLEREAEELIASRRRNQNPVKPYRGYNYGSSASGRRQYESQYNTYSSQRTGGSTGYFAASVNPSSQPENERVYESRTELNLRRPGYGYPSSGLNYGTQNQLGQAIETTSDIEEVKPAHQHATIVRVSQHSYRPSSTSNHQDQFNIGTQEQTPDLEVEPIQSVNVQPAPTVVTNVKGKADDIPQPDAEIIASTTEKTGWWSNLKNKVSNTAKNLKDKITGSSN